MLSHCPTSRLFFHLSQNAMKSLTSSLKKQMTKDTEIELIIKNLPALAFCPSLNVCAVFSYYARSFQLKQTWTICPDIFVTRTWVLKLLGQCSHNVVERTRSSTKRRPSNHQLFGLRTEDILERRLAGEKPRAKDDIFV